MLNTIRRFKPINFYYFCSSQFKKDWQYNREIQKYLNNGMINEAFGTLVKSHLEGQILDIQIYYTLYSKMQELNSDKSYAQLLYKLYRQHFHPHCLMKDWIKNLSISNDAYLSSLVSNDYQYLMETSSKYMIEQQQQSQEKISQNSQPQEHKNNVFETQEPKTKIITTKLNKQQNCEQNKQKTIKYVSEQLKNFIKTLTKDNSNVQLYNFDINYSYPNPKQQNTSKIFQTDNDNEINSQGTKIPKLESITIERIQITKKQNLQQQTQDKQ